MASHLLKERVALGRATTSRTSSSSRTFCGWRLRQQVRHCRIGLTRYVIHDALCLRRVNEGTLDASHLLAVVDKHVATPDEILGTLGVEDGA